jgi:hypothetical protein
MTVSAPTRARSQRELAHRVGCGVEVTLYWNETDNNTSIELTHTATDTTLRFDVPAHKALDAFYHPFAHTGAFIAP